MNCYLRWFKKDKWVLFCYAVIYNSFKKQAFRYGAIPWPLKKTWDLKWRPNCPLESLLLEKLKTAPLGLYSSSQKKHTHRVDWWFSTLLRLLKQMA